MSLRKRLTLLTIGAFSVGLLVLGIVVPRLVRGFLTHRLDQDLISSEQRATGAIRQYLATGTAIFPGGRSFPMATSSYYELRDDQGKLLLSLRGEAIDVTAIPRLPTTMVADRFLRPQTVQSSGGNSNWRVVVFEVQPSIQYPTAHYIVTALPTASVDETVSETVKAVTFAAIAILIAVGWLTYILVGIGLRPLRKMQRSAAGISSAGDLHQRVEQPPEKTELGQLGSTLNGMLGRLETSFEEQQENQARLRRFVSDASHELRTPLTSIRGYAELHRRGYKDPDQVDRSMDRIEQESSRMSRLVEDLLALARADEKRAVQQVPVRLDEVVSGLVEDFRVVHPDRRTTTTLAAATVIGDQALITQSVVNVLANAGIHTPPETPIDVTLITDQATAVLTIVDHGVGISPDDATRIFDRFYRSDVSRNRESGGSGLGLSITAAIIEAHGGTISVTPTSGGGATFTITLPLAVEVPDPPSSRPPVPTDASSPSNVETPSLAAPAPSSVAASASDDSNTPDNSTTANAPAAK